MTDLTARKKLAQRICNVIKNSCKKQESLRWYREINCLTYWKIKNKEYILVLLLNESLRIILIIETWIQNRFIRLSCTDIEQPQFDKDNHRTCFNYLFSSTNRGQKGKKLFQKFREVAYSWLQSNINILP